MAGLYRDLEDYWGETSTTPAALDNFFDEDSTVSWTGGNGNERAAPKSANTASVKVTSSTAFVDDSERVGNHSASGDHGGSIMDNITMDDPPQVGPAIGNSVSRGVGRSLGALGERLHEWRPPQTRKWSNTAGAVERCTNCSRLEREVAQLTNNLKTSFSRLHVSLPPSSTVRALVLGEPYILHGYQSLDDKQQLLQAALLSGDTSAIVTVLLFCRNTLSKKLLLQELEKHPVAAQTFLSYLKQRRQTSEAVEWLLSLGRKEEAVVLQYRQCLLSNDPSKREAGLKQLLQQSVMNDPSLTLYKTLIGEQLALLERQRALDQRDTKAEAANNSVLKEYPRVCGVYDKPLLTTLFYCSMYHWSDGGGGDGPPTLRHQFRLSDRQFLWGVVRGRARVKHYYLPEQLVSLLHTSRGGMLGALGGALSAVGASMGSVSAVRAALPLDRAVDALKAAGAPHAVLSGYLSLIEPRETRLRLALHHNVCPAVVEAYIALKDRAGLERYQTSQLVPGSADYIKADTALKAGRWK